MLDSRNRVEPSCSIGLHWPILAAVAATVLGLSFWSIGPITGELTEGEEADAFAGPPLVYQGLVLDPVGKPFTGAQVYFHNWRELYRTGTLKPRTESGPDGRFRFVVERTEFDLPTIFEPWRFAELVAVASGFGPGVPVQDEPEPGQGLTLRLVRDDVPIRGRLVDRAGRPVAGATIRVDSVSASPRFDLAGFLAAAAAGEKTFYEIRLKYLPRSIGQMGNFRPIPSVTTGTDGRFVLRSIGRNRLAELTIEGKDVRWISPMVRTAVGPLLKIKMFQGRASTAVQEIQGADFELAMAPSVPYEGFIRDRDSGRPIPGATITSFRLADENSMNNRLVKATTDGNGHFVLNGMPFGAGNEVLVLPPPDQPYLPSQSKLPDSTGQDSTPADLVLKRGIWARGKVVRKGTLKPVQATLRYAAAIDNPYLSQGVGFRDLFLNGNDISTRDTAPDGSYRIPVLPGHGIVVVDVHDPTHALADEQGGFDLQQFVPHLYREGTLHAEIYPTEEMADLEHDFVIGPDRARTVVGQVFDLDDRPILGVRINGQMPNHFWSRPLDSSEFQIAGLAPPRSRTFSRLIRIRSTDELNGYFLASSKRPLLFLQEERQLAAYMEVFWNIRGPIRVQLQPWGKISGRVVDAQGQPRARFGLHPKVVRPMGLLEETISHWPERFETDNAGRFQIPGLAPDASYRLEFEDASGIQSGQSLDVAPLRSGESRELGDVMATVP